MAQCKKNRVNLSYFLAKFTRYSLIGLLSVVLVSESVGASVTLAQSQIAQQTVPNPSVPLSGEKQKRYQEQVKLYQEGEELQKKGTREGYLQAIEKYQQALKIAQKIGLRGEEAEILMQIGLVNVFLSEYQQALDLYNQSLKIWQELNQPLFEAIVLSMIGDTYNNMGKTQESLDYLKRAESSFRTQKQFRYLAINLSSISRVYMRLGQTKNALHFLNQALEIYRTTYKDQVKEAHTLNSLAFINSLIGQSEVAFKYYNQAVEIYRERKDFLGQAEMLKSIGSLHGKLGKHDLALEYLNKALEIQSTKGTLVDRGLTINDIASIYSSRGDYEKAVEYYQKAKLLFHEAGWTTLETLSIGSIVSIYRNFLGNNQQALKYTEEVLKLNRKTGEKDEEASTLNQKGDIYIQQGDYQLALDAYNQALEIERSITKNPKAAARTLGNIALLYNSLGDSKLSIRTYNQALDIYRKLDNKAQQARILLYMGGVYQKNEKLDDALVSYNQAIKLLNEENYNLEISIHYGLARIYRDKEDYTKAFKSANLALELSKKHENSFQEIASLGIIGSIYLAQGDYTNALDSYNEVLDRCRKSDLKIKEAETLSTISIAYGFQQQHQKAINTLNEELKLRQTLKDKIGEAQVNYQIAINQRKLGKLETALTNIDEAIKIVESIRSNVKNPDLRTSYFATVQNYYKFKIDLLMELHKKQPSKGYDALALNTSEASRARGLVDLLTEAGANIRKGANPQLLAEEQRLQQLLNGKEKARIDILSTSKGNDVAKTTADKLGDEIADIINQQQQLKTQILTKSPEYAALKYPQPLELKGIQQQLDKDTILLQYSLGKERSYLWLVTPDSVQAYELAKGEVIEKAVENFRDVILTANTPYGKDHPDDINQPASQLSQMILAPVANKLGKKRLVIVADGALQNIPFAALADPGTPPPTPRLQGGEESKPLSLQERGLERGSYQPLLVNHEIVNLPSITAIQTQRKHLNNRLLSPKTLAVLADPFFTTEQAQGKLEALGPEISDNPQEVIKNSEKLPPLPGTRIEAEAMLKSLSSDQKTHAFGADANYNFATNPTLKQYRHLFFATHGFVNTERPELSGIALAQVDKDGKPVDEKKGYLRLGDIFNMDWAAELVVLSACETGLGKDTKGEGLVGLTRGLMYAGSKRAVVSLWKVSDKGTSELMPIFYKSVLAGKSPAVALREAQLQMWQGKEWRNPYYWAAFTLQGEWR
ncbi:CHAT domain-containing tetratricopeptide repeat protein [Calothrix sp. PCC 6303]|uniref:CHAT domain-containing tetratricopeptide repeat protein n=1 Tax=Calothrix sp. PCC 6303 TaxID=1170562 RepID=UPI0002A056B3|nr:CHAT domain-containing protein [Calothrix sp. PCC 6303]AFZ01956.1 Tetratricopeptide TPR_1 repeat-containing protein [Calothrix sp. PCC 6303]